MAFTVAHFPDIDQLIANPYWSILRTALEQKGVCIHPSGRQAFGRRWLWQNRSSVNVLHFHYVQQFYAYEGTQARLRWVLRFARNLLLARLWGYRTVFTLHNLTPTYPLQPAWVDYLGHWVATNLTDSVIVHCEAARQALAQKFGRRKNVFLVAHPHYVDVYPNTVSGTEARQRLDLAAEQTVFLFLGGIRPNKGIETLVSAFRQLSGRDLCLLIAGKPWPPTEYVEALAAQSQQDTRIRFLAEFVPDDEIQVFLNAADAVVLPFASILTSSSAILAMSFGCPVVLPAMGCMPELVGEESGVLYSPGDPAALAQALARCLELDLESMGREAMTQVRRFDWQAFGAQTLVAYGVNRA